MPLFRGEGGGLLRLPTTNKLMRAPTGECCCEECDCCVAFKDVTIAGGGTVVNDIGVQSTSDMSTNIHETAYCDQQTWTFTMTIENNTGMPWNAAMQGYTWITYLLSDFEFVSASPTEFSQTDNGSDETILWDDNYTTGETKTFTVTFRKKNCGVGQEYDINGGVQQGKDAELTIEHITCS
jgi:hypothetical protein